MAEEESGLSGRVIQAGLRSNEPSEVFFWNALRDSLREEAGVEGWSPKKEPGSRV